MKPSLDISKIEKYQRAFAAERMWTQYHTLKNLAASLSIESSELQEIFQWLSDEKVKAVMSDSQKASMIKNERKYPVHKARGNAKKYNEFED